MEEKATVIESLFEKAEAYSKTNIDLFKLKAIDKSADVVSGVAAKFLLVKIASITAIIFSIGLALWIGEMAEKVYYGFFIVTAIYVVLGLVIYLFRKPLIKTPVSNSVINKLNLDL